ncbi:MAG: intradiol ring-cleavage dioxygenase [Candidatus Rokubacteria bacterium]|nr:intradiol ring-cleavage dioxygenase [Candidatus Rokubacteria bacterium]
MRRPRARLLLASLAALALALGFHAPAAGQPACAPTPPDALGPFYEPNAPERTSTGRGLVVAGTVRSASGCAPIPGARVEWWSANSRGEYDQAHRATQAADTEGRYRYETDSPGRYPGRPPHLHARVSAPGHRPLVTQLYPRPGQTALSFDFVLVRD